MGYPIQTPKTLNPEPNLTVCGGWHGCTFRARRSALYQSCNDMSYSLNKLKGVIYRGLYRVIHRSYRVLGLRFKGGIWSII